MTLILTLCSALLCEDHRYPVPTPMACVLAQPEIAREVRPGWRIARWRCGR